MRIFLALLFVCPILLHDQTSSEKVLAKAVSYHDPQNNWPGLNATFHFKETRPTGPDRFTIIEIDNTQSYMKINRNDKEEYEVNGELAKVLKGDKDNERALVLRNYDLYLWGLPMKLYDKSTPEITLAKDENIGEKLCNVLRVQYEKDTWYFYIDDFSGRMLQYKFYKDEEAGKGELITLEDEIEVQSIKIPQKRNWYRLPEMEYLGTDILERVE